MKYWHVTNNQPIHDLYTTLQHIANKIPEDKEPESPIDSHLSQDDMTVWLQEQKNPQAARRKLFFTDHAMGLKHTLFKDLSLLYDTLVSFDKADGRFDGRLKKLPDEITVPTEPLKIRDRVIQTGNSIFSVKVKNLSGEVHSGTAWIVDKEALGHNSYRYWVISNAHVVDTIGVKEISHSLMSETRKKIYDATLVGGDHTHDVSVMYFDSTDNLEPLQISNEPQETGDQIVVVGNQLGLGMTYTEGQINDNADFTSTVALPVYQHDSSATSGNSGSPAFDEAGLVTGMMVSHIKSANAQIGHIIPIRFVMAAYQKIRASYQGPEHLGTNPHGSVFDVSLKILDNTTMKLLGINADLGYYVQGVGVGSPVERAGLEPGDIILSYDSKPVPLQIAEMVYETTSHPPGKTISLEVVTLGEPQTPKILVVTVAEHEEPLEGNVWQSPYGFTAYDIDLDQKKILAEYGKAGFQGIYLEDDDDEKKITVVPENSLVSAVNGLATPNLITFRRVFEEQMQQDTDIVLDIFTTTVVKGDQGRHARVLFNRQQSSTHMIELNSDNKAAFTTLGFTGAFLNDAQKQLLNIAEDSPAVYVRNGEYENRDLSEEPLFEGDIIMGFDTQSQICHSEGLVAYVQSRQASSEWIDLEVIRGNELIKVRRKIGTINSGSQSKSSLPEGNNPYEFFANTLDTKLLKNLGLPGKGPGVYITVPPPIKDHPYGLKTGMVITHVNGIEVYTDDDLLSAIEGYRLAQMPIYLEVSGTNRWGSPGTKVLIEILDHTR